MLRLRRRWAVSSFGTAAFLSDLRGKGYSVTPARYFWLGAGLAHLPYFPPEPISTNCMGVPFFGLSGVMRLVWACAESNRRGRGAARRRDVGFQPAELRSPPISILAFCADQNPTLRFRGVTRVRDMAHGSIPILSGSFLGWQRLRRVDRDGAGLGTALVSSHYGGMCS